MYFVTWLSQFGPSSDKGCLWSLTNRDSEAASTLLLSHRAVKRIFRSILLLNWREHMTGRKISFPFGSKEFIINIQPIWKGKAGPLIYIQFPNLSKPCLWTEDHGAFLPSITCFFSMITSTVVLNQRVCKFFISIKPIESHLTFL